MRYILLNKYPQRNTCSVWLHSWVRECCQDANYHTCSALLNALCGQKPSGMTYLQSFSGHLLPQTGFIPQISCQENEEWTLYEGKKKVLSLEHASGRWLVSGSPCFIIQDPFSFSGPKKEGLTSLQRWAEFGVYVGWFLSYSWVQKSLLCHL